MGTVFVAALLALLVASGGTVAVCVRRHGWRWGTRARVHAPRGPGAYRGAPLTEERPRGAPKRLVASAAIAFPWAALTSGVFAPSGLLLGLLCLRHPLAALALPVLLALCLSGFALGLASAWAHLGLLCCRVGAPEAAARVATWSLAHHLVVALFFGLAALVESDAGYALACLPAALGVAHAGLARAAAHGPRPAVRAAWLVA